MDPLTIIAVVKGVSELVAAFPTLERSATTLYNDIGNLIHGEPAQTAEQLIARIKTAQKAAAEA